MLEVALFFATAIAWLNVPTPFITVPTPLDNFESIFIAGPIAATNATVFIIFNCSSSDKSEKLSTSP